MKFNKDMLLLYAVTNRTEEDKEVFLKQIEDALKGGVTILQLREKNLDKESFLQEAKEVKALCEKYNVPLIINDRADIAIEAGADGVHVGIEDMSVEEIRKMAPEGFIIGATAKTKEQAETAEDSGADYLGVGAVFPSPTKTNAIRITNEMLKEICDSVKIPAVAIGGISIDNIDTIEKNVVEGVALVSAIFGADDIYEATKALQVKAKAIAK